MSNNFSFPTDHYTIFQEAPMDYGFHHQLGPTIITLPELPCIIMHSQDLNSMDAIYHYSDFQQLITATSQSIDLHPDYQMIIHNNVLSQHTNGTAINNIFPSFWPVIPEQHLQELSEIKTEALFASSKSSTELIQLSPSAAKATSLKPRQYRRKSIASLTGKYRCDLCDKGFNKQLYLKQHNKTYHNGHMPFRCQMCGKRFPDNDSHENHEAKHSSAKPFKCESCPKAFHHKTDLTRHMYVHSESMPFICELCGKGFIRKDHMLNHMDTHERKKCRQESKKLNRAQKRKLPDSMIRRRRNQPVDQTQSNLTSVF